MSNNIKLEQLHWRPSQVKELLDVCEKHNIGKRLSAPVRDFVNKHELLSPVTRELRDKYGYSGTDDQVVYKLKRLRQKYVKLRNDVSRGLRPRYCYYKELRDLFEADCLRKHGAPLPPPRVPVTEEIVVVEDENEQGTDENDDDDCEYEYLQKEEAEPIEECDPLTHGEDEDIGKKVGHSVELEPQPPATISNKKIDEMLAEFRNSQLAMMEEFCQRQKELIKEQQKWHQDMLDEEREFFIKVLTSVVDNVIKK